MACFALLLLLAAAPQRFPVQTLTVEGAKLYTAAQILSVAGLKTGQMVGKDEFEAARDKLVATGRFEVVGYKFGPAANSSGYAASFQVVEAQPLYPLTFSDLGAPSADLHAALKRRDAMHGSRIPATAEALKRYTQALEEITTKKVAAKLTPEGAEGFVVVFRPANAPPVVAEVRFRGNQVLPSETLQNAFSGIAFGREYTEPAFRQLLDTAVRPLYDARGRIRVAFPRIDTEKSKTVEGLVVSVEIDEGASYELGQVRIAGADGFDEKELLKIGAFKSGDVANFNEVSEGLERVKKRIRRQGFMRTEVAVTRIPDDTKKSVDLIIQVTEGPRFVFGALRLEGLDIHGEAAVKKLWSLKPEQPFNADYPDFFLNRIQEDNLFEGLGKTKAKVDIDEGERRVDVTLAFGAASTESDAVGPGRPGRRRP
ncbi:MAG: hypothetical protein EXQ52_04130 [Bryobacterales bacterium]|nr:hypothetical protein [Bryobacterales bacterium]